MEIPGSAVIILEHPVWELSFIVVSLFICLREMLIFVMSNMLPSGGSITALCVSQRLRGGESKLERHRMLSFGEERTELSILRNAIPAQGNFFFLRFYE